MTEKENRFILNHRVAHLSTVDDHGDPHIVPVVYAFDGERIYTPIDTKPKIKEKTDLRRVKNIRANSSVTLIIDDYSENWEKLAWLQVRGMADLIYEGEELQYGINLIEGKYPQYRKDGYKISFLIAISPSRIVSWNI